MRVLTLLLFLFLLHCSSNAQGQFVNPVVGVYGQTYILVNYVDWGFDEEILDPHCLTKTYDGHQGTDFVIRDFALMDSGVVVVAVDTGIIIYTHDGEFDREKVSDVSKGLGNYIGITHSGDYQTYYGHLRKNSILVSVGDTVLPGQPIGMVGSSGNSADPHLHFELWYDSLFYIDPFSGPCGNVNSFWEEEIPFDSSFAQWSSGLCGFVPDLDTLREPPVFRDTFNQADPAITFWNLIYGLRTGDKIRVEWFNPGGIPWYSDELVLDQDWWYYYYWTWMDTPDATHNGQWEVRFYRNDVLIESLDFWLTDQMSSVGNVEGVGEIQLTREPGQLVLLGDFPGGTSVSMTDPQGRLFSCIQANDESAIIPVNRIHSGIWLLQITSPNGAFKSVKVFLPEN